MQLKSPLLLLTSLALGLANVQFSHATPPLGTKLDPQQVLNINFTSAIATFDPSLIAYEDDIYVQRILNATLMRIAQDGSFIPDLASSYSVSPDGLTWTFKLRDANWSDGKPITASDFVYSWRRLVDPKTAAPYATYLGLAGIKNADAVNAGKLPVTALGVTALDDHTLQVQLDAPTPWFNTMLAHGVTAPLRKDVISKWGNSWTSPEHMVVSGPFKIASYKFNDELKFIPNPQYWNNANTTLTNINADFIRNPNNNYFGFLSGKYLTSNVPAQFKDKVRQELPEAVHQIKLNALNWLLVNEKRVPDVRARKAISLLADRNILTQKVVKSGIPTTILAPKSITGTKYMEESPYLTHSLSQNQAEAVQLLQQAGYSKEHPLRLNYLTEDNDNKLFVALQGLLNKGSKGLVQLNLDHVESKIYYERSSRLDYDIEGSGWTGDYPQVTTFLDLYTCGTITSYGTYCDPKLDSLLQQAKHQSDADMRAKLYAQAELLARKGYVFIPIYQTETLTLKSPRLQGYSFNAAHRYPNDFYILAK